MPPIERGSLTLMVAGAGSCPRRVVVSVGGEVDGLPEGLEVLRLVADIEAVEHDGERLRLGFEEAPRVERVVAGEGVDEGLTFHHDALAGEAEPTADADTHQHLDERGVEHQVAGLAQVSALCADRGGRLP